MEEEEEIQSLAEGGHFHLSVVAVGEEQVAAFGDIEPADFVRPSVFQHDVDEHLVKSRVLQFVIVIVGGRPDLFQQAFLFSVEAVGLETDDAVLQRIELSQGGEGLSVDFQYEVIVVVVSLHVAEFEEESGFVDFQSVDVQVIEKYLFREESAIHLWEVGVEQVELLIREGGLDVVEGLTEGGLFCTEVAQHHGQVEQLAVVGFQQPADVAVVMHDAVVDLAVVFRLDVEHGVTRVEVEVRDGHEMGLDAFCRREPHIEREDEGSDEQRLVGAQVVVGQGEGLKQAEQEVLLPVAQRFQCAHGIGEDERGGFFAACRGDAESLVDAMQEVDLTLVDDAVALQEV